MHSWLLGFVWRGALRHNRGLALTKPKGVSPRVSPARAAAGWRGWPSTHSVLLGLYRGCIRGPLEQIVNLLSCGFRPGCQFLDWPRPLAAGACFPLGL